MIKVGDLVRTNKFCGIEGVAVFWNYAGTVVHIYDVPEYTPNPEAPAWLGLERKPARTMVQCLRDMDDYESWFVAEIGDLELVPPDPDGEPIQ